MLSRVHRLRSASVRLPSGRSGSARLSFCCGRSYSGVGTPQAAEPVATPLATVHRMSRAPRRPLGAFRSISATICSFGPVAVICASWKLQEGATCCSPWSSSIRARLEERHYNRYDGARLALASQGRSHVQRLLRSVVPHRRARIGRAPSRVRGGPRILRGPSRRVDPLAPGDLRASFGCAPHHLGAQKDALRPETAALRARGRGGRCADRARSFQARLAELQAAPRRVLCSRRCEARSRAGSDRRALPLVQLRESYSLRGALRIRRRVAPDRSRSVRSGPTRQRWPAARHHSFVAGRGGPFVVSGAWVAGRWLGRRRLASPFRRRFARPRSPQIRARRPGWLG